MARKKRADGNYISRDKRPLLFNRYNRPADIVCEILALKRNTVKISVRGNATTLRRDHVMITGTNSIRVPEWLAQDRRLL